MGKSTGPGIQAPDQSFNGHGRLRKVDVSHILCDLSCIGCQFFLLYHRSKLSSLDLWQNFHDQLRTSFHQSVKQAAAGFLFIKDNFLLQKALKTVLGAHVEQKGSLVTPTRLRFDFAHFQAMTPEELEKVENLVNEKIQEQIPVVTDIMDTEEAKKSGAMALFGEKYGDKVRVVSMGDFSKELCGGTHVKNTAEIGLFKLVSEAGVAAGVRRIEALTGPSVTAYYKAQEEKIHEAAALLKTTPADLLEKIAHLQAEAKALQAENESLKSKLAKEALGDVMDKVTEVKGVKLLAASVPDVDMNGLRDLGDQLKEKLGSGVVVLASAKDGKVSLLAMVTDDAMKKGAHAGKLIKEVAAVVGGGGGGRPNMAQAGGKNPEKIDEAVAKAAEVLEGQIA